MASAKPKVAVVLSGCGVYDGSEIHESVMTLGALDRHGAEYECFAPDIPQAHVINHITGEEMDEERNVLVEAARIARGAIKDLREFDASSFDAIIFPGGFGAAKNLSTFAFNGADCSVNEDTAAAVRAMADANKPIGALCIAPAMIAGVLEGAELTIGTDAGTAEAVEKMGAKHRPAECGDIIIDAKYKLVTEPCYMLAKSIGQVAEGAEKTVVALLDLVERDRKAA